MRRVWPFAAVAVALMLAGVAGFGSTGVGGPGPAAAGTTNAQRAQASLDAMDRYLFDRRAGDYREELRARAGSHAWPYAQALAAHLLVSRLPGARTQTRARFALLERRFRHGRTYAAWPRGDMYLDDNEWLAQTLLDRGRRIDRARAAAIFGAVVDAWDTDRSHPCRGGVYWTTSPRNRDRNTVSTANGALVGLRLYNLTHEKRYLTWSTRMLGWVDRCMRDEDGLYWDHIDLAGNVERTRWSYNQGSMIGSYLELHRATGSKPALKRAEKLADASLRYYESRWYTGEPPVFSTVFFRNLLSLGAKLGRKDYFDAADRYGVRMWNGFRVRRTGLFRFGGKTTLLDQGALVQLYAELARAGRAAQRAAAAAP